jgi:transposase InsO family protein
MRQLGIQGAHLRKHWKTTRQDKRATAAPDLVNRDFSAAEPNRLWVADLTYIKTLQGILYLAAALDVFSRKVAAELAILAWIEGWYNPERIMAGLGNAQPRRIPSSVLR